MAVLTHGSSGRPLLDNSRGMARMNVLRHKHEIQSGRTSSISTQARRGMGAEGRGRGRRGAGCQGRGKGAGGRRGAGAEGLVMLVLCSQLLFLTSLFSRMSLT